LMLFRPVLLIFIVLSSCSATCTNFGVTFYDSAFVTYSPCYVGLGCCYTLTTLTIILIVAGCLGVVFLFGLCCYCCCCRRDTIIVAQQQQQQQQQQQALLPPLARARPLRRLRRLQRQLQRRSRQRLRLLRHNLLLLVVVVFGVWRNGIGSSSRS